VDTAKANASSFIDSGASATNEYIYRIKAFNADYESLYSSEVSYSPTYYDLITSVSGEGTIDPGSDSYLENSIIVFTATPEQGWEFNRWSGSLSGTNNPDSLTINSNISVTANFTQISSLISSQTDSEIKIYPNPAKNMLMIELPNEFAQKAEIRLYDYTGRLIFSKEVQGSDHSIDMKDLPAGVYLIKISDINANSITKRILKQ
jgi:hypothetical protein